MANKNILLIEPEYKNKYPPLGLMKISAFHKKLNDNVTFYKGLSSELRDKKWDKIYITTLFSFYWKITIKTIKYYKRSVKNTKNFHIGGIMSSMMPDEIEKEVGIRPYVGLLDKPAKECGLGRSSIVIDTITPDYDILEQIDYNYPANDAYIGYMTRGCVNKCSFCAVPSLEPSYKEYISLTSQINEIKKRYGEKRDLLLMDNNVLGSCKFKDIIHEIKDMGFGKGASYIPENSFEFYYSRILKNADDIVAEQNIKQVLAVFPEQRLRRVPSIFADFQSTLDEYNLVETTGECFQHRISKIYDYISPIIEKYRNKAPRTRYIDFNQGVDARLITKENMKLLSEINIRPLRIAFDSIKLKDQYISAVKCAADADIRNLSNYILYNHKDTPKDLYQRLRINIELNEEYDLKIYSFPMKYIPITAKDRKYISKDYGWCVKYIRAIQSILNVTKGAVMPGKEFFDKAFGSNQKEFFNILMMPEDYIINRFECEENGLTKKWNMELIALNNNKNEKRKIINVIKMNDFKSYEDYVNDRYWKILSHYINRV